jgi:hypothetical protein
MKLTPRDRWILALVPAIALAIGYQYVKANPMRRTLTTLREQASQRPAGNPQADFQKALAESEQIEKQLDSERARKKAFANKAVGVPQDWCQPDRARTLHELTRLCEESGVILLASSLRGGDGNNSGLPAPLHDLAKTLKEKHGMPDPQLWKFEISAPYARVAAMLKRFAASDRFILPVQMDMKIENDNSELKWTVLLWI